MIYRVKASANEEPSWGGLGGERQFTKGISRYISRYQHFKTYDNVFFRSF